jgi:very-short-patch-repair endonuclease
LSPRPVLRERVRVRAHMRPRRDSNSRLRGFARQMRRASTDAERRLWSILRGRQLSGFKFRRQHPMEGYILDFYCVAASLAIEADGGQHLDPHAVQYDQQRTAKLRAVGIEVLRFADDELLKHADIVAQTIYEELERRRPSPQPSPGVPGEGERSDEAPFVVPSPKVLGKGKRSTTGASLVPSPGTPGEG